MTEAHLARLARYRRTHRLIEGWKAPEGVEVVTVGRRTDLEVDVVLVHQGMSARSLNLRPRDREECDAQLDFLKDILMAEVAAAYDRHEVEVGEDVILNMTLAQAARAFDEGLELARCKGKGGDE